MSTQRRGWFYAIMCRSNVRRFDRLTFHLSSESGLRPSVTQRLSGF
ncbi:hypothetical protein RBSWK_03015 [Rhodopirellula baltica SWK14]|uniref:Uncharacterized protein n=1 Tax=Rhodopirellula baltica SWK14 TaxID=993516 RepID=L7CFY3_RHOBT|nr:hypothetical protein RBSWK_03015 [Rhodopirellula baltica SWK14]